MTQEQWKSIEEGDVIICDGLLTGKHGKPIGTGSSKDVILIDIDGIQRYQGAYALLPVTEKNKRAVQLLMSHFASPKDIMKTIQQKLAYRIYEMLPHTVGRSLGIADLLCALNINSTDSRWSISIWSNHMRILFDKKAGLYNLSEDNILDQSDEFCDFLLGLLDGQ